MTDINPSTQSELRQFIERLERLQEEKQAIADDFKDVMSEASGRGFDVKALRHILKLRKQDPNDRAEAEAIIATYCAALGMVQPDLFASAAE